MTTRVFVGGYSVRGGQGIGVYDLHPNTGRLTLLASEPAENASFLALAPNGRFLYAVSEVAQVEGAAGGSVLAFAVDSKTGGLARINSQPSGGRHPCHVSIHPTGRWLYTANYTDGTHSVLPIKPNGSLDAPLPPIRNDPAFRSDPAQNTRARAHCAVPETAGRFVYTCDLGLDIIGVYAVREETGTLERSSVATLPSGAGPRHLLLHPAIPVAYAINEHACSICVLARNSESGALTPIETVSTLPGRFEGRSFCADLHLSIDNRFLYASNRGHDSLAIFNVRPDGSLAAIGHVSTGGHWPRNFAVLQNGIILVANERSDTIVAFRAGLDGIPAQTGAVTDVPAPTCIIAGRNN